MTRLLVSVLSALLFLSGAAWAQSCGSLPQALNNGDTADATKVTADLEHLRTCINNISPTSAPSGTIVPFSGVVLPTGWLWANGAAVSRTTYAALWAVLGKADTVTITIASPAVVTWTSGAHGLANDWPVKLYFHRRAADRPDSGADLLREIGHDQHISARGRAERR